MLNSYNILTEKVEPSKILASDVPYFSHNITESITVENLNYIIYYFTQVEMFEQCLELQTLMAKMFDEEGNVREPSCECDYPTIGEYSLKTTCGICNKRMKP